MERLITMDKAEYVARMQAECQRMLEEVADAVNNAPTGKVISGSEMQVRNRIAEFRQKAYETAVQMRVDSTEGAFSPSQGRVGPAQGEQGAVQPQRDDGQWADQLVAPPVGRGRRGKRLSGGQAAG